MLHLPKWLTRWLGRETSISESANSIGQVFEDNSEGQTFFDTVYARFETYDESNRDHRNEHFSTDIEFLLDCTTTSLTQFERSDLFPHRIDAYFYIYRRIFEYIEWRRGSRDQIKELQKQFHQQLAITFESTKGVLPNLCLDNKDLIKRMNIRRHLMLIKHIKDVQTLNIFFVLCKLSFQSSLQVNEYDRLEWIDVFTQIDDCELPLMDIIEKYIEYKNAFEQRPLDTAALIYLIRKLHPPKNKQTSPFELFIGIINRLNLDHKTFFHQFQPVFDEGLTKQYYDYFHIASILHKLSARDDQLFNNYLTSYAWHVNIDIFWTMFLYMSKTDVINDIMQKHFPSILIRRMQTISVETFKQYYELVKECLKQIKDENRSRFLSMFEEIYHAFINKQLNDDCFSYRLSEIHMRQLINIASELSLINNLQHPSYSLIIRHLLFKLNKNILNKAYHIKDIFERINRFDNIFCVKNDPAKIIQDEWLNDYVFRVPEEWSKINTYDYNALCNAHHQNPWSIYIWSRIVHLSFFKSDTTKSHDILVSTDKWMINVKHKTFDTNDTLTIIFVKYMFEIIIVKHIKSVLLLSNIDSLLQYILCIKENSSDFIDIKLVDDFVENIKRSINDVLLLKSEYNYYFFHLQSIVPNEFRSY